MEYPGLTYIGSGKISGLYGLNETIHDQKSIGLQHLYIDDYQTDFIYSAVSAVKVHDECYYGDRVKPRSGHPQKIGSSRSYAMDGFAFVDEFKYDTFNKKDTVFCVDDDTISFTCEIVNTSEAPLDFEISSLVITTPQPTVLRKTGKGIALLSKGKRINVQGSEKDLLYRASKDAPSGFMYHGIQDILFDENIMKEDTFASEEPIAFSATKKIHLTPHEKYTFKWIISVNEQDYDFENLYDQAKAYWMNWLGESELACEEKLQTCLIGNKAINMNGFIPADLTGHYVDNRDVCIYVRDALHGARGFLYSGHFKECKEIVDLVSRLKRRPNHEIYQRYNARLEPAEGANNNVFSQIDFIGYLLRVVADYYHLTGSLLIEIDRLIEEVRILDNTPSKNGLYGPEGGVNEGVYGPAYITSTNIFIVGGLTGLIEILKAEENAVHIPYISAIVDKMVKAINDTFLQEGYFAYGYVDYHDQLVKRYDTPQLFGASLGYPVDANYKDNFYRLTDIATYYGYGYGYSEQEYHDGPWIFNTAFAAQNAYIFDDKELYERIMKWMDKHKNKYGLLPEAIDSRNENNSYINPLMWANAEYICAGYAHVIAKLRGGSL